MTTEDTTSPAGEEPSTTDPGPAHRLPGWHEYRTGFWGVLLSSAQTTLVPVVVGAALMFGTALVVGLVAEETDVLGHDLRQTIDAYTRMAVGIVVAVGAAAGLVACLASALLPWIVARALYRAADRGAARAQVPAPAQRDLLRELTAQPLRVYLISLLALGGLALVAFVAVAVEQQFDPVSLLALAITVAVLGAAAAGLWAIKARLRPAHRHWAAAVQRYWGSVEVLVVHQHVDRERARGECEDPAAGRAIGSAPARDLSHTWRGRLGTGLSNVGTLVVVLTVCLVTLAVRIRLPGAAGIPGYIPDPRYYTPEVERGIDLMITAAGVGAAVAVVLLLAGALLTALTRVAERAALAAAAADPSAPRPEAALLRRYSAPRSLLLAELVSGIGGAGLVAAITGRILAGQGEPLFLGTEVLTGWFLLTAVVAIVLGGLCQAVELVGGRAGRNRVLQRWPLRRADD